MSFTSKMPLKSDKPLKGNFRFGAEKKQKKKFYKQKWFVVVATLFLLVFVVGGALAYKTGYVLNKISDADNSVFKSLLNVIPGVGNDLEAEEDGRINVLLLGMRGANIPGGGLLADTIMVVSLNTKENKIAMISIPRDLYVKVPGTENRSKINGVHAYGEDGGKGKGLEQMKKIVGEVTGLKIHYAASINFFGFKQLVDAVGGVDITLETAFYETHQFVQGNECGGQFVLEAGKNTLNGERALCYVRARENTSDFDRNKRQQVVMEALKDKLVSLGTLTDFSKLSKILDAIGDNVRTDMSSGEMKSMYEEYSGLVNAEKYQRVFENSEEGLLMVPSESNGAGYILVPRTGMDNYSQINEVCRNIFTLPPQSDIKPQKQYYKPATEEETTDKKKSDSKVKGDSDEKTEDDSNDDKETDSSDSKKKKSSDKN